MAIITLDGVPAVLQRLQRLSTGVLPPAGEALYEEGNRIIGHSVQLVPVDTGLLRSTAHVERPVISGTRVEVELRYGGHGLADYALVVHEDVTINHPNGGEAKYLAKPLYTAINGMLQRIGEDIRRAL